MSKTKQRPRGYWHTVVRQADHGKYFDVANSSESNAAQIAAKKMGFTATTRVLSNNKYRVWVYKEQTQSD